MFKIYFFYAYLYIHCEHNKIIYNVGYKLINIFGICNYMKIIVKFINVCLASICLPYFT